MQLENLIAQSEVKYLLPLYHSCKQQFSGVHLPSHDETHHARVWQYAKQLLHQLHSQGTSIKVINIEQLIVSVFFHDQGMSVTFSKEHGKASRQLCETFFTTSDIVVSYDLEGVLEAIENHDKKEYTPLLISSREFDLRKLLNIADDLDAFGTIGIYRYLEIYLLRNMSLNILPEAIMTNLSSRFTHFQKAFTYDPLFLEVQQKRYEDTVRFFSDLKEQLLQNPSASNGPISIVNCIATEIIVKKRNVSEVSEEVISTHRDDDVRRFFERLKKEME
jgi:hypothetical protein